MPSLLRITITACLISSAPAWAGESCPGLAQLQNMLRASASGKGPAVACGSWTTVVGRILRTDRPGGRRLENERPLDVREAQRNLDSALKSPEVREKMEQLRREVQDDNLRLAYEAAILDDEGYYLARDLRIQQLSERIK
jgi:hypothetical protein